jgi:hypothetical protein
MLLQPGFDALHQAASQQVNGPTPLQVTEQYSVTQSADFSPIVQTIHSWFVRSGLFPEANQPQDSIATSAEAEFAGSACSYLASASSSYLTKSFLQPFGALSVRTAEFGESLSENFLSTRTLITEKATDMHDETEGTPEGEKIPQRLCIATLDARGSSAR